MAYCAERIFSGILISKFNCEPVIDNISNQRVETFLKNCHPRAKKRRCKQFWKFCPTENNEEYSLRLTGLTLLCSKEPMNKPNKGFLSSCRNRTLVNLVDNNHSKFRFYGRKPTNSTINRKFLSKLYHTPGSKLIESFTRQQ